MEIELKELIGQGAYADVYKATDELGRSLAVKFVETDAVGEDFVRKQAEALARIDSENVVNVVCYETLPEPESGDEKPAIVLEFVQGKTLESELNRSWSKKEAKEVIRSIVSGLRDIHDAGLVHGDLHGGNILVRDSESQLIDPLYENSLASLKKENRERAIRADVKALTRRINSILTVSEFSRDSRRRFKHGMLDCETTKEVEELFENAIDGKPENQTSGHNSGSTEVQGPSLLLALVRRNEEILTKGFLRKKDSTTEKVGEAKGAYLSNENRVWKWEEPEHLVQLGGELFGEMQVGQDFVKSLRMDPLGDQPGLALEPLDRYDYEGRLWELMRAFRLVGVSPGRMYYFAKRYVYGGGAHGHTVVRFVCRELPGFSELDPFGAIEGERIVSDYEAVLVEQTEHYPPGPFEKISEEILPKPDLTAVYPNLTEEGELTAVCQLTVSAPYAASDAQWDSYTVSVRVQDRDTARAFPEWGEVPGVVSKMAEAEQEATVLGWTQGNVEASAKFREEA